MPVSMRFGNKNGEQYSVLDRLQYKYDGNGNITEIRENGELLARYTYDKLDRLVREDNKKLGKTWLYSYDNNGNILSKRELEFTQKDGAELEEWYSETTLYGYDGDRLMSFGDETIKYDLIGNPTTYRGKTAQWANGRHLKNYNGVAFTYDGQGRRISKGAVSFTYDSNGKLLKQSNGLSFIYDNSGVVGLKYNGSTYFYRKDVQGNIIAILDSTGKVMVEYIYDAWGNHAVQVLDEACEVLSQLNPFRYRGYYYDTETGLYYLKTRYYDPETGRFITIDDLSYLDPETINGLNLYAYCGNNPVMGYDPDGTLNWWQKLLIGFAVIAVLAIATIVTAGIAGVGIGAAFSAGFAGAAIGAGASGFAVTVAAGAFAGAVIGAGCGFGMGALIGGLSTGTWQGALDGAANGFMMGAITGAISGGVRSGMNYARTTPLLRSVSRNELDSVKATGKFSQGNGSMEDKWFATNKSDVSQWAKWFKQSDYIGIRVSKGALANGSVLYNAMLDNIGSAYCIGVNYLNTIISSMWFF